MQRYMPGVCIGDAYRGTVVFVARAIVRIGVRKPFPTTLLFVSRWLP